MSIGASGQKKRTTMSIVDESAYGEVPSGPPTLVEIYESNDTLKPNPEYVKSAFRNAGRNPPPNILVGMSVGGVLGAQLVYGHYDSLLQKLLFSSGWSAAEEHITDATTISFESIADSSTDYAKILDSGNGLANYDTYKTFRLVTADGTNDGVYKIHSVAAGEIEVEKGDFTTQSAVTAGATTISQYGSIENGITCASFLGERHYQDQSPALFHQYLGLLMNETELTIAPKQLIGMNFTVVGARQQQQSTTVGDGSNTPRPADTSMNAVQHVSPIIIGGETLLLRQISMRFGNGLEALERVGQLGAFDYSADDFSVTGEIQAYLTTASGASSAAEYAKSLAGTKSDIWIPMRDGSGNDLVWDTPTVAFTDPDMSPGDSSPGPVIVRLPFTAEVRTAENKTFRLSRQPAA